MKFCRRCQQQKPETEFNFKRKALGIRQVYCKACSRELIKQHYQKNRQYYLKKANERNKRVRYELMKYIRAYLLKHPCVDCGEKDPVVLEFDHIRREDKKDDISTLSKYTSLGPLKKEIVKCEVRCANCHRRKTAKSFGWYNILQGTPL